MMRRLFCPGLLETGLVTRGLWAIRAGWVNLYAVETAHGLVCFDAGGNAARVTRALAGTSRSASEVRALFLTHSHWDHAAGVKAFPHAVIHAGGLATRPTARSRCLRAGAWVRLHDGETVTVDGLAVRAIHTPGHTPDSCSYVADGRWLFTGDTIRLRHGEARPFAPWLSRDRHAQRQSIRTLAGVEGLTHLLTAHSGGTADPAAALQHWRETR